MPTADLRKFRKSTLSVEARKAIKSIRSRPKKSRSQQNSRPNYARSTSTPHPPSSTGFRKARKKHTTRLANFLRQKLDLQMGKNAHFPMHINQ
jgi:hypothetical protein